MTTPCPPKVFKARDDDSVKLYAPKEVLTYSDMYVGAVLNVFSRGFELEEADEHTLKHMEENPNEYPHASFERVRELMNDLTWRHI